MIAWTGFVMHEAGVRTRLEDSAVRQRYRTDEVDLPWMMAEFKA
jgi:tRNA A37 threonylcarbamoyltransferase TsaD